MDWENKMKTNRGSKWFLSKQETKLPKLKKKKVKSEILVKGYLFFFFEYMLGNEGVESPNTKNKLLIWLRNIFIFIFLQYHIQTVKDRIKESVNTFMLQSICTCYIRNMIIQRLKNHLPNNSKRIHTNENPRNNVQIPKDPKKEKISQLKTN